MSFVSVSDIKFAWTLAFFLYDKCFTKVERADVKYISFFREVRSLGVSLKELEEVAKKAQEDRIAARSATDQTLTDQEYCNAQLQPLADVTGDFRETLGECETLLNNRQSFRRNAANFVENVIWHTTVERHITILTERLHFHVTKVLFVIKPLEIQLLLGIRNEVQGLREEIRQLTAAIHQNPSEHSITIPERVIARFEDALKRDRPTAVHDVTNIPLKEGFDAVVYCLTKSTTEFNPGIDPSRRTPEEPQFLNLLKARWLLDKLKASSELAAVGPNSLWMRYGNEIEWKLLNEYKRFESKSLIAPPSDVISRLSDDYYLIWIAQAPTVRPPDLAEQRPLEDLILELSLPSPAAGRKLVLTVFRISDVEFRMVTATTWTDEQNRSMVERESFEINMTTTRFIPAYAVPATNTRSQALLLYQTQDHHPLWQYLKCANDVFQFQQALTGYFVCCEMVNVKWSFNGSSKPEKTGTGKLQLWQVKRLSKVVRNREIDTSSGAGLVSPVRSPLLPLMSPQSPSTPDFRTQSTNDSTATYLSSSSITSRVTGNRDNGTVIFPPEPPVLIMYTMCDDRYTLQHLELHDLYIDPKKCKCRRSPLSCRTAVLQTSEETIDVRRLSALEKKEQGLHSWDLAPFRLPRHPKYKKLEIFPKVKYICLDFPTVEDRETFCKEFAGLKQLRSHDLRMYEKAFLELQQKNSSTSRRRG